jgi:hypothetical protein
VLFVCRHGTCAMCYQRLLQQPGYTASCPLCRTALLEPSPGTLTSAEAGAHTNTFLEESVAAGSFLGCLAVWHAIWPTTTKYLRTCAALSVECPVDTRPAVQAHHEDSFLSNLVAVC